MKTKFSEKDKRFLIEEVKSSKRSHMRKKSTASTNIVDSYSNCIQKDSRSRAKSKDELDVMYSRHVEEVKEKYQKILRKNPKKQLGLDINIELKRCEICFNFNNDRVLLICDYCEDAYHMYCLNPRMKKIPAGDFVCPKCEEELESYSTRQTKLDMSFSYKVKKNQKTCNKCKESIQESNRSKSVDKVSAKETPSIEDSSLKTCFKCQKDFHLKCFRKDWENLVVKPEKKGKGGKCKIICDNCENLINKELRATKMTDYFKKEKNTYYNSFFNQVMKKNEDKMKVDYNSDNASVDSTRSSDNFKMPKKSAKDNSGKFKLPKELTNEQKNILQKSLFRALKVKNIEFDDNLIYNDPDCPKSLNNSSLEVGVQTISDYNKKIYYQFKQKTNRAEYPPLEIVDDDIQGFIVRATDDISILTLITEYTGDVTFARKKIFDKNDSIMDLIRTPSSSTSLVICPENKGNLARFISGINNFDEKSLKKQNVNSIKFDIDGSVHILLYTARTIKKNEILYYDYNAGGLESYPTHYFV